MKPSYEELEQKLIESERYGRQTDITIDNMEMKLAQMAAENAGLKAVCEDRRTFIMNGVQLGYIEVPTVETDPALETIRIAVSPQEPTQATDAFLAEVRASAVSDYANKRGFSFHHGSIHAHFGNGDVMVGSVTFDNGDAGINFAPVREKTGGVGTHYEWTKGKTAEQVDSVFVIASSNAEGLEVIRDKLADAIAQLRQGGAV
ncbi:TPA: hypothetical protein ACPYW0_004575 [Citrobacter freundii]